MRTTFFFLPAMVAAMVVMPRPAGPPTTLALPTSIATEVKLTGLLPTDLIPAATNVCWDASNVNPKQPVITGDPAELRREVVNIPPITFTPRYSADVVTTQWVETTMNSIRTWVEVIYTQTFAEVPDQWPTAERGEIGMGTLTGQIGITKTLDAGGMATAIPGGWKGGALAMAVVVGGLV